jgi:tetratricopeptide (TPR) repeat protein
LVSSLVLLRAAQGRLSDALRTVEALPATSSTSNVDAGMLRGSAHLTTGDLDATAKAWKTTAQAPALLAYVGLLERAAAMASRLPDESWRLDLYRGIVAWRQGNGDAGAEQMRLALTKSQNLPQAHFWLGEMAAGAGRHAEAVESFKRFFSTYFQAGGGIFRGALRPRALLLLARSELALGRRDAARVAVDQFLDDWKRADPGLLMLTEARALRKQIGDEPGR